MEVLRGIEKLINTPMFSLDDEGIARKLPTLPAPPPLGSNSTGLPSPRQAKRCGASL